MARKPTLLYWVTTRKYTSEYGSETITEHNFTNKNKAKADFLAECALYVREPDMTVDLSQEPQNAGLDSHGFRSGHTTVAAKYRRNTWVQLHPLWFE